MGWDVNHTFLYLHDERDFRNFRWKNTLQQQKRALYDKDLYTVCATFRKRELLGFGRSGNRVVLITKH